MAKVKNSIEKVWARLGKDISNQETLFIGDNIIDMYDVYRDIIFDPNEGVIYFKVEYNEKILATVKITVRENRINCYYEPYSDIPTVTDGKYYGNVMTNLNIIINDHLKKL